MKARTCYRTLVHSSRLVLAVVACLSMGCSDDSDPSPVRPGDGGLGDAVVPTEGSTVDNSKCPSCDGDKSAKDGVTPLCVKTVAGSVVDEADKPVEGFNIQVCDKYECKQLPTDSAGKIEELLCRYMYNPHYEVLGLSKYVSYAIPIENEVTTVPPITLIALPTTGADIPKTNPAAATTIQSGDVSLTLAANADIDIDELNNTEEDAQKFRSVMVPKAKFPAAAAQEHAFDVVYGLAPVYASFNPPAAMKIANKAGLPDKTEVEFYYQSLTLDGAEAKFFGNWIKAGTGKVAGDSIVSDTGGSNGLMHLSVLGIKKK